jgi:hypothetical protein
MKISLLFERLALDYRQIFTHLKIIGEYWFIFYIL